MSAAMCDSLFTSLREALGADASWADLSEVLGVPRPHISRWRHGARSPQMGKLDEVLSAWNAHPDLPRAELVMSGGGALRVRFTT